MKISLKVLFHITLKIVRKYIIHKMGEWWGGEIDNLFNEGKDSFIKDGTFQFLGDKSSWNTCQVLFILYLHLFTGMVSDFCQLETNIKSYFKKIQYLLIHLNSNV